MAYDFRLLDYRQRCTLAPNGAAYEQKQFNQLTPILVKQQLQFQVLTQFGFAVSIDAIMTPPDPLFPDSLLEQPEIEREQLDDTFWRVTWRYVMAVEDAYTVDLDDYAWPTAPTFEAVPA